MAYLTNGEEILVHPEAFASMDDYDLLAYDRTLTADLVQAHKTLDLALVDQLRASSKALSDFLYARALQLTPDTLRMVLLDMGKRS